MNHVETRLMHYFVVVAEEQHFAQAALRLGVSPPTLTHQIKKLENQLGARLLKRKGNTKVALTGAGQRFLADARQALRQVEQAALRAGQAGRGELGRLQLGFTTVVCSAGLLEKWTGEFEEAHPAIEIAIRRLAPIGQIAGILRNELDAGFARPPRKYPSGVRGFEIYRQPLALALPSGHALARHKDISPAMLADEAFVSITPERDIGFFSYTDAIARIGNFIPRVVRHDGDFVAVLGYVGHGHGIAVVPELMKTTNIANVVYRNIAADPVPQTSIAFVYGSDPSPSAKLLIRHMQRHALRNHGSRTAPPRNQDRIIIPKTLNVDRHPEVAARSAALEGCGPSASAVALRGSALHAERLRVTDVSQWK